MTSISQFFSDPLSAWLLIGDVVATVLVGVGIILETPEDPSLYQKVAVALVIIGVIAETVCSVWLFTHDASIIEGQNAKIISLGGDISSQQKEIGAQQRTIKSQQETIKSQDEKIIVLEKIITPRHWYGAQNGYYLGSPTATSLVENLNIDSALRGFHLTALIQVVPEYEALRFANEVAFGLRDAGWIVKDLDVATSHVAPLAIQDGVQLWTGARHDDAWKAAEALQASMSVHGIYGARFNAKLHNIPGSLLLPKEDIRSVPPDGTVVIMIGDKPGFAELAKIEGDEYRASHPQGK